MGELDEILKLANKRNASDVHIQPGLAPVLRIHTVLVPLDSESLSAEAAERLIFTVMSCTRITAWECR